MSRALWPQRLRPGFHVLGRTQDGFSLVLAVLQNFTVLEGFAVAQPREKHYPIYF
jgi:hypothetical protein